MTKRFGFTLAEVLITLGIIGVVAAMTIPTLMNQTSGAEFKTGYKKMIATLSQAITMNVAIDGNDFSDAVAGNSDAKSVYSIMAGRMNVISSTSGLVTTLGFGTNNYTMYFSDGMVISFPSASAGCTTQGQSDCSMVVDVNGDKKPNSLSTATNETTRTNIKDQFAIDFYNQQVTPRKERGKYVMYN